MPEQESSVGPVKTIRGYFPTTGGFIQGGSSLQGVNPVAKVSESQEELGIMLANLDALKNLAERLEKKTENVLRPATPSDRERSPKPPRSTPMGQAMQELNGKAESCIAHFADLDRRIDI